MGSLRKEMCLGKYFKNFEVQGYKYLLGREDVL